MEKVLEIENLKLSFHRKGGKVEAVRGVSLDINPGEIVALVGESGCGKTTLCRSILMLHQSHSRIERGKIFLCGKEVTALSEAELTACRGKVAAMVFQDAMSALDPVFPIGQQIVEKLITGGKIEKKEAFARAERLLCQVGIGQSEERAKQYPHQFSGGMLQRAAVAAALAENPRLLIADEPTTALDFETQEKVVELLRSLCRKEGRAMLFVTHDLRLVEKIADRIAVMQAGRIVECEETSRLFTEPKHPYTKELLSYIKIKGDNIDGQDKKEKKSLLAAKAVSKGFHLGRGQYRQVFSDFNLTINRGEFLGLMGRSGCGKSTLARCLMGIYQPEKGEIIGRKSCRMQMIFQDSLSAFNPRMSMAEIIAEPLVIGGKTDKRKIREKVFSVMAQIELDLSLADRRPGQLSGGQRQRAAIARALITDPDLIIADEPVSSLDVSLQAQIISLLRRIQKERGLAVLMISHDGPMLERICDRIVKMD